MKSGPVRGGLQPARTPWGHNPAARRSLAENAVHVAPHRRWQPQVSATTGDLVGPLGFGSATSASSSEDLAETRPQCVP